MSETKREQYARLEPVILANPNEEYRYLGLVHLAELAKWIHEEEGTLKAEEYGSHNTPEHVSTTGECPMCGTDNLQIDPPFAECDECGWMGRA